MKINVRMVNGTTQELEFPDGSTVVDLRQIIAEKFEYDTVSLRLCFKGTVLAAEAKTLVDAGVHENDVIVVVGKKKSQVKEAVKVAPPPAQTSVSTPQQQQEQTAVVPAPPQPTEPTSSGALTLGGDATPAPSATAASPPPLTHSHITPQPTIPSSPSAPVSGVDEEVISAMTAMGFERELVLRALRAAYNNPDRAVEYCLYGFPAGTAAMAAHQPASASPQVPDPARQLAQLISGGESQQPSLLAQQLAEMPNFEQIRTLILSNPEQMLPLALQQLHSTNPALAELIAQNPQEFMQILTMGLPGGLSNSTSSSGSGNRSDSADEGGQRVVTLGPQDMEPIERLMALGGFSQQQAARAYIMAGRSEEYAAAILFEAMESENYDE